MTAVIVSTVGHNNQGPSRIRRVFHVRDSGVDCIEQGSGSLRVRKKEPVEYLLGIPGEVRFESRRFSEGNQKCFVSISIAIFVQ
jgi:hypothetical protein